MINLEECCKKYSIFPKKIKKTSSFTILYEEDATYLLKEKDSFKKELFSYLESIHYPYYLPLLNDYDDSYELYPYLEDKVADFQVKGKQIIQAMSFLHLKSMYIEELDLNKRKELYDGIDKRIEELRVYYENLQDYITQFSFPRVDYYYLINNISMFYESLFMAKHFLEEWYELKPEKVRKSLVLHNASLDNFRINNNSYFVDFHDCYKDYFIEDFVSFYKREVGNLNMMDLYLEYTSKIPLNKEEKKLLFCLLSIPDKLELNSYTYDNTVKIENELEKIHKTFQFVSEENKEDQKSNHEVFEE